jgi:hypothetical protein
MSGSTLLSSVYGYEVSTSNDSLVKIVENAVHRLSEAALAGSTSLCLYQVACTFSTELNRLLCQYHCLDEVYTFLDAGRWVEAHCKRLAQRGIGDGQPSVQLVQGSDRKPFHLTNDSSISSLPQRPRDQPSIRF